MSTHTSLRDTSRETAPELGAIAERFVQARLQGASLPDFPGTIPPDLETAYRVQDMAIARWPDRVVGWKVGFIAPERRDVSGDERLLGPIFARNLWPAQAGSTGLPVFAGGFGAIEAEYVIRLEADVPAGKQDWTPAETESLPATLHTGVEVASSPLATINMLGPLVVVSDFGNNNGLVLGSEIPGWRGIPEHELVCSTHIDGNEVGLGGAIRLPGGLRAAFAFALNRLARRGLVARAGDLIATGNATGIHDILPGQHARVSFAGHGDIVCHALAAPRIGHAAAEDSV